MAQKRVVLPCASVVRISVSSPAMVRLTHSSSSSAVLATALQAPVGALNRVVTRIVVSSPE
ncbi:MAG: hypothetical protein WD397_11500 [Wenzhouxiangellaceae bacterium]